LSHRIWISLHADRYQGRKLKLISLAFLLLCGAAPAAWAQNEIESLKLWLPSRGLQVPATLTRPVDPPDRPPLVVMAHGHGGSRDEGGGFRQLAEILASKGIASIRVDFPGCGESREPFVVNDIGHMLSDLRAAQDYALAQPAFNHDRVGLLGYSMGGRLVMLSGSQDFSYTAVALWAPAASDGAADFHAFLGGEQQYSQWKDHASQHGSVMISNPWGQSQELSLAWFTELEQGRPLSAFAGFKNPLLVLHGSADEIIPAANSQAIAKLLPQTRRILLDKGTHGLGFYDDDPATAKRVLQLTADFFADTLSGK
jgi:dienelactone hydrolase